ncbi:MAG: hypothetical protein M0011_02615 [Elusimicrobia bacterium]|nr:hypothetical protein [Elusimicrobiota bacterium]
MTRILSTAKDVLVENTGLKFPRLVDISLKKGQYHVILDMYDAAAKPGDAASRTYDVRIDEAGRLRGYTLLKRAG